MLIDNDKMIEIVIEAGKAIMDIYHTDDFGVEMKSDNSPLTKADKASNKVITESLREFYPDIPIISEEEKEIPYENRKNWRRFFLVDPLDGTKEFIKRNGEFTVNIALIEDGYPVFGIVSAPVLDDIYIGTKGEGAFKITKGVKEEIKVNQNTGEGIIAVQSRSHAGEAEKEFLAKFNVVESISRGSSLKFCMVAEGKAHLYFRGGPTMEWDTAAGQGVVEAAGGMVENGGRRFIYNKESLLNPGFLVSSFDVENNF